MALGNEVTNALTATVTSTEDATQLVPINRGFGNLNFESVFGLFGYWILEAIGDNVISLPAARIFQLYIKNNDPTNNIIVKYTPHGGAQQVSPALGPGEVFVIWQNSTSSSIASAGIDALTLTASAANTSVEYFIGA